MYSIKQKEIYTLVKKQNDILLKTIINIFSKNKQIVISNSFKEILKNPYDFKKMLKKIYPNQVDIICTFGNDGWIYDVNYSKYELCNNECNIDTIGIVDFFTINKTNDIIFDTAIYLDRNDNEKLNKSFNNYKNEDFYSSASILMDLIDSQTIKQELYDANGNIDINITQGWKGFLNVFEKHFFEYFDGKMPKKDRKKQKEFMEENIFNMYEKNSKIGLELFSIFYTLSVIFEDNDWKNYPNKPKIINRNWLMHGMYNIEDIKQIDCLKLIIILNKISKFYYDIRLNCI